MEITREIFWNVPFWARWAVYLFAIIIIYFLVRGILLKFRLWKKGKPENRFDRTWERIKTVFIFGFGHKKTLKDKYPGILHFLLFWGFLFLFLGTATITIQEDLTQPIFKLNFLHGSFYEYFSFVLDLAGILAILGMAIFMFRRYLQKPKRLDLKPEDFWISSLILLVLITGFLVEGFRIAVTLPYFEVWSFVGFWAAKVFLALGMGESLSKILHKVFWWGHMFLALGLIVSIGYTKLLHLFSSGANQFFRSFAPKGELKPIFDIENAESFGVGKIEEFTWKQLLDGDACTRCGRCQERCPAFLSEKPLNPKKVTLDLKEHLFEMKPFLLAGKEQNERKPLIGGVILEDEIWACTTCRACMEECPVLIEHIPKIVDMRRNLVLMQSSFPNEAKLVFKNMETNYNPWGIGFSQRGDWAKGLNLKTMAEQKGEYLFWVGCAGSFDDRNKKVSKAVVKILQASGVDFAILGTEETCCGDSARRIGNEYLAQILMQGNIEIFKNYDIKKIITTCPHCYNTFKNEYPQFGGNYEAYHHTEFIWNLIKTKKLILKNAQNLNLTYHDSCYLGRYNDIYSEPREILKSLGEIELEELDLKRERSFCCGAGGGRMWMEENLGKRINQMRVEQIMAKNFNTVATACPYCLTMLEDGVKEKGQTENISVFDLAELVEKSL